MSSATKLTPDDSVDTSPHFSKPQAWQWSHILHIALQHKKPLLLANLIAIFATLLSVPVPLLIPLLLDEVVLKQPGALVAWVEVFFPESWHSATLYIVFITALTVTLRFSAMLLGVAQMRQFTIISKTVVYRIRKQLIGHLQQVAMSEYERLGSGKLTAHLVTDLDTLDSFIGSSISKLLVAIFSIIGTAMVLLWLNWQLALFILLFNPLVIYSTTVLGRKVKHLKKKENNAYALFQETLSETLEGIQQIRAYNREQYYLQRLARSAKKIKDHSIAYTWKTDAAARFSFNIFLFGFDTFRAIGLLMILFSDLTIGQMMAIFGYLWFMLGPIQEVLNIQYEYHAAKAALQRVNQLFELQWEKHYPQQQDPFQHDSAIAIRLENIHFAYHPEQRAENKWTLHNVSLDIRAGEKVALVGASGAGKTTLAQILLGLYPIQKGQIYFNDTPVTETGFEAVREQMATVLQHPAMFNDSLRMNLTLGKQHSETALWEALRIAQLEDFVLALPQGLETILGRHGMRLSGGQQQRVAVARMVLAQPKAVILDEATSALDADTEQRLHQALQNYLQDKTTLIIAHRLSAVKQADRIIVFEAGQIIETGSHQQLLEKRGVYTHLYANQI